MMSKFLREPAREYSHLKGRGQIKPDLKILFTMIWKKFNIEFRAVNPYI